MIFRNAMENAKDVGTVLMIKVFLVWQADRIFSGIEEVRKTSRKKRKKKKTAPGRRQSDSVKAFLSASKELKSRYRA